MMMEGVSSEQPAADQPSAKAAHHEAGHAVAAWCLGVEIEYVTLKDWVMKEPLTQLVQRDYPTDREVAETWAIQYLAGGAAEERFTGEPSIGSHDDRKNAAEVVEPFMPDVDERKALLASLDEQAVQLVTDRWSLIGALAKGLIELRETSRDPFHQMTGDEIDQFLSDRQSR